MTDIEDMIGLVVLFGIAIVIAMFLEKKFITTQVQTSPSPNSMTTTTFEVPSIGVGIR